MKDWPREKNKPPPPSPVVRVCVCWVGMRMATLLVCVPSTFTDIFNYYCQCLCSRLPLKSLFAFLRATLAFLGKWTVLLPPRHILTLDANLCNIWIKVSFWPSFLYLYVIKGKRLAVWLRLTHLQRELNFAIHYTVYLKRKRGVNHRCSIWSSEIASEKIYMQEETWQLGPQRKSKT